MNTLEVRLGVMPLPKDIDFNKIHLNVDVYLCDPILDNEYRVWLPCPFNGTEADYDDWVDELTTLAKNSGLQLVFDEPMAAILLDIKNKDPKLTLMTNTCIKRFRSQMKADQ